MPGGAGQQGWVCPLALGGSAGIQGQGGRVSPLHQTEQRVPVLSLPVLPQRGGCLQCSDLGKMRPQGESVALGLSTPLEFRGLGCCKTHPTTRMGASLFELSHCWHLPCTPKSHRKWPQQWLAPSQLHAGYLASQTLSWPHPSAEG